MFRVTLKNYPVIAWEQNSYNINLDNDKNYIGTSVKTDSGWNINRRIDLYNRNPRYPKIIVDTDPYHDDCPCYEIIPEWEESIKRGELPQGYYESLAMLYLYCNKEQSISYFKKSLTNTKYKSIITSILKILNTNVVFQT